MNISLYDEQIVKLQAMANECDMRELAISDNLKWKMSDKESLILRNDMAYELGGGDRAAVGMMAYTTSKELVDKDSVYLAGEELKNIHTDIPYARLTFVRLKEEYIKENNEANLYGIMRAIDYVRYHAYPQGYMMRISSINEREPVRISKDAIKQGISFAAVGNELIKAYKKRKEVDAVKIIYVTDSRADYQGIKQIAHKCEMITDSLNHMFNGLSMDCSSCSSKELCDEIEGLRKLHISL